MSHVVRLIFITGILSLPAFGKVPVGFKSMQQCKEYSKLKKYETPDIIFPGEQPTRIKYPFIVSIHSSDKDPWLWCGGVLIDKRFVLTAAHCLKVPEHAVFIKVGSETGGGHRYNISRSIIHPDRSTSYYNDIGLIELAKDVEFSSNVHPACLQVSRNIPDDDWMTILWTISGKGTTYNLLTYPTHEVKSDGCQDLLYSTISPLRVIDYLQICAREDREEQNATILIDRPTVVIRKDISTQQFIVFGIHSIRITDYVSRPLAIYQLSTRISSYIGWIESIVWPEHPMQGCSKINFDI